MSSFFGQPDDPPEVVKARKERPECLVSSERSVSVVYRRPGEAGAGGPVRNEQNRWWMTCPEDRGRRRLIHQSGEAGAALNEDKFLAPQEAEFGIEGILRDFIEGLGGNSSILPPPFPPSATIAGRAPAGGPAMGAPEVFGAAPAPLPPRLADKGAGKGVYI